jgi:hypothetical protein
MANGRNVAVIDFGVTPVAEASFTITDAAITAGMVIECFMSGGDSVAAQNTTADHDHAAASFRLSPSLGGSGSFTVNIYCLIDMCWGQFKMQYAYST